MGNECKQCTPTLNNDAYILNKHSLWKRIHSKVHLSNIRYIQNKTEIPKVTFFVNL